MEQTSISKVFEYGSSSVRMRTVGNGNVQVCVTDFAKAFPNKNLSTIVNSKEIQEYVSEMSKIKNFSSADLLQVTHGGNAGEQGTWANSKVALRIAQKLSTKFAIWVDEHVEELLTKGSTSINYKMPQTYSDALRELADTIEANERLMLENRHKAEVIREQRPKVAFADAMLSSEDTITIAEMAKILCQNGYKTGEIRLYEQLRQEGYLCSYGADYNLPYQRYIEMGIFVIKKGTRSGKNGEQRVTRTTKVTTKGQKYLINKFVVKDITLFD